MVRPAGAAYYGYSYGSHNAKNIEGQAVASDAIYGWIFRSQINTGGAAAFNNAESLLLESFIMNHDAAYNVLYTDGSVKTFSDAGRSLFKEYLVMELVAGGSPSLSDVSKLYENYFDSLYAQD